MKLSERALSKRKWIQWFLFIIWCFLILWVTLLIRKPYEQRVFRPDLFYEFRSLAIDYKYGIKHILLFLENILLFIPFGFLFPQKRNAILVIFLGALMSLSIEGLQYLLYLGDCELDDVIANSLGTGIGVMLWEYSKIFFRKSSMDEYDSLYTEGNMYKKYIKRILDIFFSLLALIVLGIPMLVVAALVKHDVGSPVLFGQHRIGKDNKEFKMYKFRSMTDARDENGVYLPDPERITKLGHFIRTTSIDELPSLLNIIKGDMSIIGPRPLPTRYLSRYTERQKRRHEVRPGLSNPSVVNGRNDQSWEAQFEGDVWYVDHVNFLVDAKSVFDTIKIVLTHKGATAADGDCRGEFIGTASMEDLMIDSEGNYMKLGNNAWKKQD